MNVYHESPDYVQTSLAAAMSLGLEKGKFFRNAACTCLNLLLTYPEGCAASCAYCGLNCSRDDGGERTFIRVKWPVYSMDQILDQLKTRPHPFQRMCMSMITHRHAVQDAASIIQKFKDDINLPVSALISPTIMKGREDLQRLKDAGADHCGIAVDTATPELSSQYRGIGVGGPHRWETYWQTLAEAVEVFGEGKAGVHLIVGLGESEEEMVKIIDQANRMGAPTHLFSFFPEAGSLLQNAAQPGLGHYRRIQLARHLLNSHQLDFESIRFSPQGRIVDFGVDIEPFIQAGTAFMTSGCPGPDGNTACNRPFANERPNQLLRNYPFPPAAEDLDLVRGQIWSEE